MRGSLLVPVACPGLVIPAVPTAADPREGTLLLVGYSGGFRPSELAAIRRDQLNLSTVVSAAARVFT